MEYHQFNEICHFHIHLDENCKEEGGT